MAIRRRSAGAAPARSATRRGDRRGRVAPVAAAPDACARCPTPQSPPPSDHRDASPALPKPAPPHQTDPTLAAALFAAWSGDPAVVVASPPGAGKTRLVVHLAEQFNRRAGLSVAIATQTVRRRSTSPIARPRSVAPSRCSARASRQRPVDAPSARRSYLKGVGRPQPLARHRGGHHRALALGQRARVHRRRVHRRLFFSPCMAYLT